MAEAVFCGVLILMIKFFLGLAITPRPGFSGLVQMVMAVQLVVIATPALIMTIMLTRSPAQNAAAAPAVLGRGAGGVLLAVAVHPLVAGLQRDRDAHLSVQRRRAARADIAVQRGRTASA